MSWSMSLSGPKESVIEELRNAEDIINQARRAVDHLPGTEAIVSLSGSASTYGAGGSQAASFYVSGSTPTPPAPAVEPVNVLETTTDAQANSSSAPSEAA